MMRPLWVDVEATEFAPLDGDLTADIAIIGGGLTGVGAAWALRDPGLSVALVETRSLGSGASGRNGGFVLAGPAMSYAEAVDLQGEEAARQVWNLTRENNLHIGRLVAEHNIDCGFLRCGSMSVAQSEDEMDLLRRSHDGLAAIGVSTAMVAAEELPEPFNRTYLGGIYFPGNGAMNSGMFVRAMGRIAGRTIRLFERSHVTSMEREDVWVLRTAGGTIRAPSVILASNGYTAQFLPETPIQPTRGQVLATAALDRVIVPFPMYGNFGYQYWRQTVEGRLVVGGWRDVDPDTELLADEEYNETIQNHLREFALSVAGPEVEIQYRWAGIMGFTPDSSPIVGAVSGKSGLYIAAGYSGHGVSMAFTCGGLVARMAVGETVRIPSAFRPERYLEGAKAD